MQLTAMKQQRIHHMPQFDCCLRAIGRFAFDQNAALVPNPCLQHLSSICAVDVLALH